MRTLAIWVSMSAVCFAQRFVGDDLQAPDYYGQPSAVFRMEIVGHDGIPISVGTDSIVGGAAGVDWRMNVDVDDSQQATVNQVVVAFDLLEGFGQTDVEMALRVEGRTSVTLDMNPTGSEPGYFRIEPFGIEYWTIQGTYHNRDYVNEIDWTSAHDNQKTRGAVSHLELGYGDYPGTLHARTAIHSGAARPELDLLIKTYVNDLELWTDPLWLEPEFGISGFRLASPIDGLLHAFDAGDANLDGAFDSTDLVQVFTAGLYDTGQVADWTSGDWNLDGAFNSSDLVRAFTAGGYESAARAVAVPEPSGSWVVFCGIAGLIWKKGFVKCT